MQNVSTRYHVTLALYVDLHTQKTCQKTDDGARVRFFAKFEAVQLITYKIPIIHLHGDF